MRYMPDATVLCSLREVTMGRHMWARLVEPDLNCLPQYYATISGIRFFLKYMNVHCTYFIEKKGSKQHAHIYSAQIRIEDKRKRGTNLFAGVNVKLMN